MIISHKYKFIFIKTKKTAGTSIEVYLSQLCGLNDIITPIYPHVDGHVSRNYKGFSVPIYDLYESTSRGMIRKFKRFIKNIKYYNHMSGKQIKSKISQNIWKDYFKFCVDRNPWDKVVSNYCMVNHNNNGKIDFDSFIVNGALPHNLRQYSSADESLLVDKVIKYENLNSELSTVFNNLGIPFDGQLTIKAKSNYRSDKRHYRAYYNDNSKKIVGDAFKKEIELHGYKF